MENYKYDGTTAVCTQGRFFNSTINKEATQLTIREYFYTNQDQIFCNSCEIYTILLPSVFQDDHIVGQPICIGCRDHLILFQYLTNKIKYIRFFFVDTRSQSLKLFEDTEKYLKREFAAVCPMQCFFSPDMRLILLPLPQQVLPPKRPSKLLMVKTTEFSDDIHLNATGTKQSRLQDKKFQNVAFYPNYAQRLVISWVSDSCSSCQLRVYDTLTSKEVRKMSHKFGRTSHVELDTTESESDSDEELVSFSLKQTYLMFSKCGDIICLICQVDDNVCNSYLNVYTFNSESLIMLSSESVKLDTSVFCGKKPSLCSIMSACDSTLHIWAVERGKMPTRKVYSAKLNREPCLKMLCRAKLLQHFSRNILYVLKLSEEVMNYISFNTRIE